MVFIDGQNLVYACQQFANEQGPDYKFYCREEDLERYLVEIQPNRKHIQTRFYTSIAETDPDRGDQDVERFEKQWKKQKALETKLKWHVFSKRTKAYPFYCPHCRWSGDQTQIICQKCGKKIKKLENKGVDVALATDLLVYGLSDTASSYDVAMLVSGDNDFVPVIEKLKDRRPQVRIEIAQFNNAVGFPMRDVAHRFHPLDGHADKIGRLYQKKI